MKNQYSIDPEPARPAPTWVRRRWLEENYSLSKGVLRQLREAGIVRSFNVGKDRSSRAYRLSDIDAYLASITEGVGFEPPPPPMIDDRPEATEEDFAELLRKAGKTA